MALRDENPFIDADLQLIISTYEKEANNHDTEASLYPPLAGSLVKTKTSAKDSIANVESYLGKTSSVNASDIVSSISSSEAEDVATKLKSFLQDCFPCSLRPTEKHQLPDATALSHAFEKDISQKFNHLKDIEDVMKGSVVFDDLCEILNAMKVHCIPDLVRVLGLLKILLSKMSINMSNIQQGIFGFAMSFLSSFFQSVASLIDQFDIVVTTPIECILTQLEIQYAELNRQFVGTTSSIQQAGIDVAREARQRDLLTSPRRHEETIVERQRRLTAEREARRSGFATTPRELPQVPSTPISRTARSLGNQGEELGKGVLLIKSQIQRGVNLLKEKLEYYIEQLEEFLKLEHNQDSSLIDFLKAKQELVRSIATVKALVEGGKNGVSCGSDKPLSLPELEILGTTLASPGHRAITIDPDGNITVTLNPRAEQAPAVVIKSKSCLKSVDKVDLAKLSAWADELDAVIPEL